MMRCDNNLMQELAKRMRMAREIWYVQERTRYDDSANGTLQ